MAAITQEKIINMLGITGGVEPVLIPSNIVGKINFITIYNWSDNLIIIAPSHIKTEAEGVFVAKAAPYSVITVPVSVDIQASLNVIWSNPLGTGGAAPKVARLLFTSENLNLNGSLAPSYTFLNPLSAQVKINSVFHSEVNVFDVAPVEIVAESEYRLYLLVQNAGAYRVFIRFGPAAALNTGIMLNPGGSFEMSYAAGNLVPNAMSAIAENALADPAFPGSLVLITRGSSLNVN